MLPKRRTLLLAAGILCVMVLFAPVAQAITIRLAEVQENVAVVKGRKAAAYQTIFWEGVPVTTASKNGSFNFEGDVPTDCVGTLDDGVTSIDVELDNCPSDPGGGGGVGAELLPLAEQPAAHTGDAVRAVGFVGDLVISGGEDAYLRSWTPEHNTDSWELLEYGWVPLDHTIYDLETSTDGSFVVTGEGGWNGGPGSDTLRVWNVTGSLVGTTAPIGFVYCVAISPDTLWTVASGFYGDIVVYETASLDLVTTKKTKKKRTKALAFSPGGTALASTSTAGRIQLWSFPQGNCTLGSCELSLLPVPMSHSGSWTFPIALSPDYDSTPEGKEDAIEIVSGTDSGTIKVWTITELASGEPSVSFVSVDSGAVYCLDWSPDGGKIVAGGSGDITVYDANTLEILFQNLDAHDGRVNDVAFSPDSPWIASGGADGALKIWELSTE